MGIANTLSYPGAPRAADRRLSSARTYGLLSILLLVSTSVAAAGVGDKFPPRESTRIDLASIPLGGGLLSHWGSLPVWILWRDAKQLAALRAAPAAALGAPRGRQWLGSLIYANELHPRLPALLALDQVALEARPLRSRRPDWLVVVAFSPYDGCDLEREPVRDDRPDTEPLVAFRNPCGGERYDYAGRVIKGHHFAAQWNLYIPPHRFLDPHTLLIGLGDPPRAVPRVDLGLRVDYRSMAPRDRLFEAARRGREKIVRATLAFGVPVDARDREGNTALMLAALKGHATVAAALLAAGADPDAANTQGITPIYAAVFGGDAALVRLLSAHEADLNRRCTAKPCRGSPLNAALGWIRNSSRAEAVVRALLDGGADPQQQYDGRNAYDWAIAGFHERLLPLLRAAPRRAVDRANQE